MGRSIGAVVAIAASLLLAAPGPAGAAGEADPLSVTVTVDGRSVADRTVAVEPSQPVPLVITAVNGGDVDRQVRSVRLSGVALALTFFAYDTTAPFEVPAHGSVTRTLVLDLGRPGRAGGRAAAASVELLDARPRGARRARHGHRRPRLVLVGLRRRSASAMLVLTVLAWADGAARAGPAPAVAPTGGAAALRFLPAGFGTGLVAVVSLSVLRVVAARAARSRSRWCSAPRRSRSAARLPDAAPGGAPADHHLDLTVGATTAVLDPATRPAGPSAVTATRRMHG